MSQTLVEYQATTQTAQRIAELDATVNEMRSNQIQTINNGNGTTLLDQTGLVSTANFPRVNVASGGSQSTASASFVDLTGSSVTITTGRTVRVLFLVTFEGLNTSYGASGTTGVRFQLNDSIAGSQISGPLFGNSSIQSVGVNYTTSGGFVTSINSTTLNESLNVETKSYGLVSVFTAGTHVSTLQFEQFGGGTATMTYWSLIGLVLGS